MRVSCLMYDIDKQERKIAFILEVGDEDEFMSPPETPTPNLNQETVPLRKLIMMNLSCHPIV